MGSVAAMADGEILRIDKKPMMVASMTAALSKLTARFSISVCTI